MALTNDTITPFTYHSIQVFLVIYAFSIVFGRLYCAMHSFTDCAAGVTVGTAIWAAQLRWGDAFDAWVSANGWAGKRFNFVLDILLICIFSPNRCPFDWSILGTSSCRAC